MNVVQGSMSRMTSPDGMEIRFTTKDVNEADRLFASWAGKKPELVVDIHPKKKRRSLDANAYMWVLADKIASVLFSTKEEVYRIAVKEVGAFYDAVFDTKDVAGIDESWSSNGVGWFTDILHSTDQVTSMRLYKGSSTYDSKQMARLIDYIVEEAKGVGIETETPDEIARLKASWR